MDEKPPRKKKQDFIFFMEDGLFLALWKFVFQEIEPEQDIMDFKELSNSSSTSVVFKTLKDFIEAKNLQFPKLQHYINIDPENDLYLPPNEATLKNYPKSTQSRILKASRSIIENTFSLEDIEVLLPITATFLGLIYFYTDGIDRKTRLGITTTLDSYMDRFLNNELLVVKKNYLAFEKQKQVFFEKIKSSNAINKYGENFVISHTIEHTKKDTLEFLFVQTLYALQRLEYLKVLAVWYEDEYGVKHTYSANIVLEDKLIEEITEIYKTENPQTHFEKLDEQRGVLHFAGKQITISRAGKETFPLQLLQTLSKESDRYWFEDEILEDWGYSKKEIEELPTNRVYFASVSINRAIQKDAQIDDFIEHTTKKFRINPKYIKS